MTAIGYLRSLKWPDSVQGAVDLASKTVAAGAAALIGLAYHHYQQKQLDLANIHAQEEQRLQRDLAAVREQREDARATYGFFVTGMPDTFVSDGAVAKLRIMIAYCNDPVNARVPIVATACRNLPAAPSPPPTSSANLTHEVTQPDYSNSAQAQRANLSTAAAEAGTAPALDARWFAVVGTVPLSDPAAATALRQTLSVSLRNAGMVEPVQLWRTQISHSFALTLGGPRAQSEAIALAARVRSTGIVTDAFAQPNRNWSHAL